MKLCSALLLSLILTVIPSLSSGINPCLYNREDVLPCLDYYNAGVAVPSANQYTIHATRFQVGPNGLPICVKRIEGQLLEDIEDLGTPQVKFLYSPGAEQNPPQNYTNQIVEEFNVQCESGRIAFIDFDAFHLEPKNCYDGIEQKCRDYVEINAGVDGSAEYCGNALPGQFTVGSGNFTLKLRTSFYTGYPGFRIFVTCFNEDEDPTTAPESTTTVAEITTTTAESTTTIAENASTTDENTTTIADNSTTIDDSTTTVVESTTTDADNTTTTNESTTTLSTVETTTTEAPSGTTTSSESVKKRSTKLAIEENSKPKPLQPIILTSEEKRILNSLVESLFRVALSKAHYKITTWPPPSYLKNEPRDILSLEELSKLTLQDTIAVEPDTNLRLSRSLLPSVKEGENAKVSKFSRNDHRRSRRKSLATDYQVELVYSATLDAVRSESDQALHPVIRTVASSYVTIARRLAPRQLKLAQLEYKRELSLQPAPVEEDLAVQPIAKL